MESSTYLLNTVGCYGYWWNRLCFLLFSYSFWVSLNSVLLWVLLNIFCFLLFSFLFWVSLISVLLWVFLNRFCFLFFSFLFWVYLNLMLLWVSLNRFCFLFFSFFFVSLNTMYLTWNVMLNVMVLMSVVLVFQLLMFFRILDLLYNPSWFVCGNETGAIKETVSILPLLMQIMKTVLIGLAGNQIFV